MVSKRLLLTTAALAALALAGCSSTGPHSAFTPHVDRAGLDPLLDAPLRTETVCKGAGLFTAGTKLGGFSFECPDLDVVATLNELRDAGSKKYIIPRRECKEGLYESWRRKIRNYTG